MHTFHTYYHESLQYFPTYLWTFTLTNSQVREGFSHPVHYSLALASGRSSIKYRLTLLIDGYFFFIAPPFSLASSILEMAASKADEIAKYTEEEL
jgi:hypothetical protein